MFGIKKLTERVDILIDLVSDLIEGEYYMSISLDKLIAEVAEVKSIEASAITLIKGISGRIAEAVAAATSIDPETQAKLDAITAELSASGDALAAAVAANTPAAPVAEEPVAEVAPEAPVAE